MKNTDTQKRASFVVTQENGYEVQKDCLVNLQTGEITVGSNRLEVQSSKYDANSKIVAQRVEYKGTEFSVSKESFDNKEKLKVEDMGNFLCLSMRPDNTKYDNVIPHKAGLRYKNK